jgi:hypothetical protein
VAGGSLASVVVARVCLAGALLLVGVVSSGCLDGAELENPERFHQYPLAPGGAAGTGVSSGGAPAAGTAGTGMAGMAGTGTAGSAGAAGGGGTGVVLPCDIVGAMKANCASTGCHDVGYHSADLDFSNLDAIAAQMVDQPALHGGIRCTPSTELFRECTVEERAARGCPNALLIDSKNFAESWVVKKLNGGEMDCGDAMPLPPGNSPTKGWDPARKDCFLAYFQSLIPATPAP